MSIHKLGEYNSELGRRLEVSRYQSNDSGAKRTEWIIKVDDSAERAMSYTATVEDLCDLIKLFQDEVDRLDKKDS